MKNLVMKEQSFCAVERLPRAKQDGAYGLLRLAADDIGSGRMPCPDWAWLGLADGDVALARELKKKWTGPRDPEVSSIVEAVTAYYCFDENVVGWKVRPFVDLYDPRLWDEAEREEALGPAFLFIEESGYCNLRGNERRLQARSEAVYDLAMELRAGPPVADFRFAWEKVAPFVQATEGLEGKALAEAWNDVFRALLEGEPEPEPVVEPEPEPEPVVEPEPEPVVEPEPVSCPFRMGTLKRKPASSKKGKKRR